MIEETLDINTQEGEIEIYPGMYHGFAFPQRWCYDKQAAERHWERLLALYGHRRGAS